MFWIIGILFIFIVAYMIIKLTLDTKKNPDSNLGILDHPSTYEKQDIEMVDDRLNKSKTNKTVDQDITSWEEKF